MPTQNANKTGVDNSSRYWFATTSDNSSSRDSAIGLLQSFPQLPWYCSLMGNRFEQPPPENENNSSSNGDGKESSNHSPSVPKNPGLPLVPSPHTEGEVTRDEKWAVSQIADLHQELKQAGSKEESDEVYQILRYARSMASERSKRVTKTLLWDTEDTSLKPETQDRILDALAVEPGWFHNWFDNPAQNKTAQTTLFAVSAFNSGTKTFLGP